MTAPADIKPDVTGTDIKSTMNPVEGIASISYTDIFNYKQ